MQLVENAHENLVVDAEENPRQHVLALTASKVADGLIDPKLVLSWLLTQLGGGAFWASLLVPVRESGALLPQLFIAGALQRLARRKWAWSAGALGQAAGALGILLVALTLEGPVAGAMIVLCLAILALSRAVCSASYKDVLGRTVPKKARGGVTGTASSVAAGGVILFALTLIVLEERRFALVIGAITLAALAWMLGAVMMARVAEKAAEPEEPLSLRETLGQLALLKERPQLARFVLCRTLLIGTALAPPYFVLLMEDGSGFAGLGGLILASSIASLMSSWVWGRLSDRSSRRVLMLSGLAGGLVLAAVVVLWALGLTGAGYALPVALFGLMIAYHGVRQGRSVHLVDMAPEADRAAYTAVANTVVGLALLLGGGIFAGVAALSVPLALALFSGMALGAAAVAHGLDEVQDD